MQYLTYDCARVRKPEPVKTFALDTVLEVNGLYYCVYYS